MENKWIIDVSKTNTAFCFSLLTFSDKRSNSHGENALEDLNHLYKFGIEAGYSTIKYYLKAPLSILGTVYLSGQNIATRSELHH